MYEVALGYIVGSAASLLLFRTWIKERIVSGTLDMLIAEDYIRSYIDRDGVTQLSKLDEDIMSQEISPEMWEVFEKAINELKEEAEDDGEDDTP